MPGIRFGPITVIESILVAICMPFKFHLILNVFGIGFSKVNLNCNGVV